MLINDDGNFYAHIKEQLQIKGSNIPKKTSNLDAIEKRLLEMVDSLKIAKYNPDKDDDF
ncbi:MAG: hypothetical protein PHF25_00305 [Candidatus Margulisbacteria bacterium]|nr:hypothetical protein [Candidatus Margulisiibacteriota bacterium]